MASFSEMFLDSFAVLGMLAKLVAVLQTVGCLLGSDTCEKDSFPVVLVLCLLLVFGLSLLAVMKLVFSIVFLKLIVFLFIFGSLIPLKLIFVCAIHFFFFALHFLIEVPQPQYHLLGLEDFTFFVNEF